jgi:hypothetical protein
MSTSLSARILDQPPLNRYGVLDNQRFEVARLGVSSMDELRTATGLAADKAAAAIGIGSARELEGLPALGLADRERLQRRALFPDDARLAITDVVPVAGKVMSRKPFALRVSYVAGSQAVPGLVSLRVGWKGAPFVVEKVINSKEAAASACDVRFNAKQTLPVGPAVFHVTLFSRAGAQACFRVTCYVLPSNPFALSLSPNGSFVTGTWSARGVHNGDAYDTGVAVTLSNGDAGPVPMSGNFTWKFWGSGVGSYIVEEGTGNFGIGAFSVGSFSTWGGWIAFHSPQGSGIFNFYNSKKDMTIEILMDRTDGGVTVSGDITARTMFQFGVNLTQVAFEDFTGQEWSDLDTAGQVTREIYERHDVTLVTDDRGIRRADAGPYELVTSSQEAHDLWNDWSGPDSNDNIDMFVVNQVAIPIPNDGTADGLDGSIPGPTSHAGPDSGTIANKGGFVDANGVRRLDSAYLGMLMGHELGHYLGLVHVAEAGNLMLPSSGTTDTNLTYDQYKTLIKHGSVSIA